MINWIDKIGQIPSDWDAVNAKSYLILESGQRPAVHVTDDPNDIPSLGGENITNDGFLDFGNLRYISKEYYSRMTKGKILENDILINKDGANTGKLAMAENLPFEESAVNEHIFIVRNTGEFDQRFLFYFLLSTKGQNQVKAKVIGSAQGGINNSVFKGVFIPKPSLTEQEAIVSVFKQIDEAIQSTKESIAAAERVKKSLMQNLLTGKLKPDGTWRKEDELQTTKIAKLPRNWALIKAKDLCEKVTDGTHDTPSPSDTGFPLVTSKNLKNGKVDLEDCYLISEKDFVEVNKRSKVDQYDVLFGMIGTVGNPQIVAQKPVLFAIKNVGLFKLSGNKELAVWIRNYLSSAMFERYKLRQLAGTTQQFVSLGFLRKIPIPVPVINNTIDFKQIETINSKATSIFTIIEENYNVISNLEVLKKALMQKLFTGKVRLKKEFIEQFKEVTDGQAVRA
jgi:type I restriction enzyme S subunit